MEITDLEVQESNMKKNPGRKERRKLERHNRRQEGKEAMKRNEMRQKGVWKGASK